MEYKASMDTLCKAITIGAIILFSIAALTIISVTHLNYNNGYAALIYYGEIVLFIVIILFSYLYAPKSYSLNNEDLIINRLIKNKAIKIANISEIRQIDKTDLSGTIRTFGNGGVFGYYGKYYNSKIGSMTWYVTQRKNRILITTTNGKKIVISPDDINLLDELQNKIRK